jgi:hypothetical protein
MGMPEGIGALLDMGWGGVTGLLNGLAAAGSTVSSASVGFVPVGSSSSLRRRNIVQDLSSDTVSNPLRRSGRGVPSAEASLDTPSIFDAKNSCLTIEIERKLSNVPGTITNIPLMVCRDLHSHYSAD